ncbi:thiamine pyrophosphate-dependent enzyme [Isoptericola sp. S6320L]|uniref:thiamine pyrophosphate-dependent enzyme n=1 Tax=Isoptericola sp. S6320L TaxID=2926411 RepID=UPI001FF4D43E|nr:thiamine pyrophosphate-dependent enzyme [Isoptericola sp. S6320L]MCK0117607.1 thiamine pyrophosphate-dependent enzyme [Isoptericola sp. S6320L]
MTSSGTVPRPVVDLVARVTGDEKHDPSAHSTLDVVWVLYDQVLRVFPDDPEHPDRDRFLLSKGHGPASTYAVLAARGFFPAEWLDDVASWDSPLGHHPDRTLVPGIEIGSGSLGHGLPIAVGMALGLRDRSRARVVVLVGDAELDEGSNAEAIAVAGRFGLDNLSCVVVDNHSDNLGWPGGIGARFALEGWAAADVGTRDHAALSAALRATAPDRPTAVVVDVPAGPEVAA